MAALPDDEPPQDPDAFRYALARRIYLFLDHWRGCRERGCKRHRRCLAPRAACSNRAPVRSTPDRRAAVMAEVYRALRAELERRDAAG